MNQRSLSQAVALNGRVAAFSSPASVEGLNRLSAGHIFFAHDAIAAAAWDALTPFEQKLADRFPDRRKNSFTAARIALKLLAYQLELIGPEQEAHTMETVNPPDRRPILPGAAGFHCSVSHDRRYVIAVAAKKPIGVDIEAISPKLVKGAHIFMNQEEQSVIGASGMNRSVGATLVWTAKEAAAKALNLHLMDAWSAVRLKQLGVDGSCFRYGGHLLTATHLFEGDGVISIVSV
jgi:phosphopantetheinyl transferase